MTENTIPMRTSIKNMKVGESINFPIEKVRTIRVLASDLGLQYNRLYRTRASQQNRTITVIRKS